jgi:uncharacterized protein (DUF1684 family)
MSETNYFERVRELRAARDERMRTNPRSWLALIGLFRLEEGENPFGSGESTKITIAGCPNVKCGSFYLESGQVTLVPLPNLGITINEQSFESRLVQTDRDEAPDLIRVGSLSMMVLLRGQNYFLRVWDANSPEMKKFHGLQYYPVNPEYQIAAKVSYYDPPKEIRIQDAIGTKYDGHLIGEAQFIVHGIACILVAEEDGDELLFSFTDATREDTTYPGGRYLTVAKPENDQVILDFNLAVNWPCAYTPFATCPIPHAANRLPVRIEAGEMKYQAH